MEPICGNYTIESFKHLYPVNLSCCLFLLANEMIHPNSDTPILMINLRNKDKVILNNQCGYLMRTKVSSSDEGGVAAGFAVLDSVLLTDEVILS
jgi:hypothetical protein